MCVGPSSHQQTGTCLPTEPTDSYCICDWSGLKQLGNNDLVKQSTRLKRGQCAFSGLRVWNQLTTDIKAITDTRVFRRKLKILFDFRQHTLSTQQHCSDPPVTCGWQHRLCIIVLYCIVLYCIALYNVSIR